MYSCLVAARSSSRVAACLLRVPLPFACSGVDGIGTRSGYGRFQSSMEKLPFILFDLATFHFIMNFVLLHLVI